MALHGTLTHWKTRVLAAQLEISPAHALGLLEALWHVTSEDAPSGNIGRLPNKAIAMQMFTNIDPDRLIAAMLASGHLDPHPVHRLIVHDWHVHADYNTKRKVNRRGALMHTANGDVQPITINDASSPVTTGQGESSANSDLNNLATNDASSPVTNASSPVNGGLQRVITRLNPTPGPEPGPEPGPKKQKQKPGPAAKRGTGDLAESSFRSPVGAGVEWPTVFDPAPDAPPSPAPKPKTPEPKATTKPDPRHLEFKYAIQAYWISQNPKAELPWDDREGGALGIYLRASPNITLSQFSAYLANRIRSQDVNHAERPSVWIGDIVRYASGPLDRYGKPLNGKSPPSTVGTNGTGAWSAEAVAARERAEEDEERRSYFMWLGMSLIYREQHPWPGRVFEREIA